MHTIQEILKLYGPDYIKKHKLSKEQYKAYNAMSNCKTDELGFHTITCEHCGNTITSFNSCRNRHCPMCQSYAREKWIQKETDNLLDIPYFHIVTTVPSELNEIALYNKKIFYNILFEATSKSILTLAEDPKWLGAKVGITSILHTWGQTLEFHPHIHSIVTGGGLKNDKWINSKSDYLFKVQVLSSMFRNLFLKLLKEQNLNFPPELEYLKDFTNFKHFLEPLYEKQWITYIEPPKGSPENVVEYAGRYSFRVAISNQRIKSIDNGLITFEYKDYEDNGKIKLMTITAEEFIRRLLLHVLPDHFTKIKHYGILTNRNKKEMLKKCRNLISRTINKSFISLTTKKRKLKEFICSECGGTQFIYSFHYRPKNSS